MQSIITCVLCYAEDSRAKLNLWKLGEIIRSAAVGYTKNVIYFCVYSGGDCCFPSSSFFVAPLAHALTITFERLRFAPPRVGWHPCSSTHIILEFVPPYFPTILKARRRRKKLGFSVSRMRFLGVFCIKIGAEGAGNFWGFFVSINGFVSINAPGWQAAWEIEDAEHNHWYHLPKT